MGAAVIAAGLLDIGSKAGAGVLDLLDIVLVVPSEPSVMPARLASTRATSLALAALMALAAELVELLRRHHDIAVVFDADMDGARRVVEAVNRRPVNHRAGRRSRRRPARHRR